MTRGVNGLKRLGRGIGPFKGQKGQDLVGGPLGPSVQEKRLLLGRWGGRRKNP